MTEKVKLNVKEELQSSSVEEIQKEYLQNCQKEKLCCLHISVDQNAGTLIRLASLFGLSEVILLGKRSYNARQAVGMQNYIPVSRITATKGNHSEFLDSEVILSHLKEWSKTHSIIFIEQGGILLSKAFEKK